MVEAADMGKVLLATVHAHRGLLSIEPILARYWGVFLISYGITTHKQAIPTQLSQGKFPRSDSLSSRAFLCRHVHARGVSLLGSIFVGQLKGCTHLYSPLSTLSVLSPRGVITRPSGSSHSRRSVMGSITHF
jgi:hypothetical protein